MAPRAAATRSCSAPQAAAGTKPTVRSPSAWSPAPSIRVPAGTKHWHGAKADSWFSHVAFITPGPDLSNEWLEPVTDEVYGALPTSADTVTNS